MIANYETYGFTVSADHLPKSCTACPFWGMSLETPEEGMCYITGHIILTDGSHDEKRMDDCPIVERKKHIKMIQDDDGNYVPEECCTFGRNFETGELEIDDVSLPCGGDCSCGGTFEDPCQNCIIQQIMNEYAKSEEDDWIPVDKKMPEENESIFAKLKGTDEWKPGMFEKISKNVLATVKYSDGTLLSKQAYTIDGKWKTELSCLDGTVIAWKPYPEPYKEK